MVGNLAFSAVDQSRIAPAASERTRHVLQYATGGWGEGLIRGGTAASGVRGIKGVVADAEPGMADSALVMRAGYTSGRDGAGVCPAPSA